MESEPKRNNNPDEYVKNKIEGSEYVKFDKDKYLKPLFEYEAYRKYGDIEGKVGDLEISLSYVWDNNKVSSPSTRKLEKLILKNDESELDILKLLPDDVSFYITTNTDKEDSSFDSVHLRKEKKIFINVPILSVDGILTILHEIGHRNRDQQQKFGEQIKDENSLQIFKVSKILEKVLAGLPLRNPNIKDAHRVLQDERDSWSFALQKIRPFMKDLNISIEDLENIVHHYSLYSYSLLIRDNVNLEK